MRASGQVFRAIRRQVFDLTQESFGKKFQLAAETISRMENRTDGYRVSLKHLRELRQLRPPRDRAAEFQSLLAELEACLRAEEAEEFGALALLAPPPSQVGAEDPPEETGSPGERPTREEIRQAQEAARQAQDSTDRAQQLHALIEARYTEEAQRAEQLRQAHEARLAGEAQRAEQLRQADEARRAEEAQRAEQLRQADKARRAEEAQRAEQLRQADESRRTEEARERAEVMRHLSEEVRQAQSATREAGDAARIAKESAELAQQITAAAMKLIRRSRYITAAVAVVIGPMISTAIVRYADARRERETDTLAREEKPLPAPHPTEESPPPPVPDEAADTAGLDGGTALTEALLHALPFPLHGVPGQKPVPCAPGDEEFHGYCYRKAEVKAGHCEDLLLYEPSSGWCRAHHYGYLPVYMSRKHNNSVEPQ